MTRGSSFAGSALGDPLVESSFAPASGGPSPKSHGGMIGELLPPGAISVEVLFPDSRADDCSELLFPEESAQLHNAVESRLQEFATARALARQALGGLGLPPAPILRGASGEPLWPSGIVGSITHCTGYRAAAVARTSQMQTLGIDAEIDQPLPPEVVGSILVAAEVAWLASAPGKRSWDRLLFSAKESVYKAWFPLTHRWLDFADVAVTIDPAAAAFRVRPLGNLPQKFAQILSQLSGRFLMHNGIILTAAFLPQRP